VLRYLFDTDHLTLFDQGHAQVGLRLTNEPAGSVGLSPITVEEYLRGRLAALARARMGAERIRRYALLIASVQMLQSWPVAPFDQAAEDQFQILLGQKLRVGTQDLKIASVALANKLILVTRNQRDFGRVAGLTLEDWSQ
jgi:tRNA(fMet)-specific endonuclease VapC